MYNSQAPYASTREGNKVTRVQQKVADAHYLPNESGFNQVPEPAQFPTRSRKREKGQRGKGNQQAAQNNANNGRRGQASELANSDHSLLSADSNSIPKPPANSKASLASAKAGPRTPFEQVEEIFAEGGRAKKPSSSFNVWGALSFHTITPSDSTPIISSEMYSRLVREQEMKRQSRLLNIGADMSACPSACSLNTPSVESLDSVSEPGLASTPSLRVSKPDSNDVFFTKSSLQAFNFLPKDIGNVENVAFYTQQGGDDMHGPDGSSDMEQDTASVSRESVHSSASSSRMSLAFAVPFTPNVWQNSAHAPEPSHADARRFLNSKHTAFKPTQTGFFNAIQIPPVSSVSNALPI